VRPITEKDVYLRALHWSLFLSSGALMGAYADAEPPGADRSAAASPLLKTASLESALLTPPLEGPGSNMIALGKEATDNGRGMLFANPHWFWDGPERWFEYQMTVPGKMNVYGGGILGAPVVLFGTNEHVAWSHTLSTPKRYTVYELKLPPGAPTSYLYDGKVRKMVPRTVTVLAKAADGSLVKRSHTFWETHNGLVLQNESYRWTATRAYAVREVNMSFRWLNQQLAMNMATSIDDLDKVGRTYLAIPFLNTIGVDATGKALYADRTAVPNVTNAKLAACVTSEVGKTVLAQQRLPVMDGWRSECEWGEDPGTPVKGVFGVSSLPQLARADYVTNSNDSYWTNNLRHPLEGYPLIIGDERTPRSLRTRIGLTKIEHRLAGSDGLPGDRFTLDQLQALTMNNRVLSGELWRDAVVGMCKSMPAEEVGDACGVLASWDLTENVDSAGAVLWRRFFDNLKPDAQPYDPIPADVYAVPFDPQDPMNTPRGLNVENPRVRNALRAAVADLRTSRIPLNAALREYQYDERGGVRIPIPGGPSSPGQYNLIMNRTGWTPGKGWPDISTGSSFILWTQFTESGPRGRSVMTYSQSNNPQSPHHADQTRLFADLKTKPMLFSEPDIASDPALQLTRICSSGSC
jgi:acyl-homoserine-lactone acylase